MLWEITVLSNLSEPTLLSMQMEREFSNGWLAGSLYMKVISKETIQLRSARKHLPWLLFLFTWKMQMMIALSMQTLLSLSPLPPLKIFLE